MQVSYNRELEKPTYRYGLFKDEELITCSVILILTILFSNILISSIIALSMILYVAFFRYKRPKGYDIHFFKAIVRSKRMRLGKQERIFK